MKKRKGLSVEEKRDRMLQIFHSKLEVFNFKEIEKFSVKAGIVPQTVKDVLELLVADGLVNDDKIGSGRFYWSFPSQALKTLQKQEQILTTQLNAVVEESKELEQRIKAERAARTQTPSRRKLEEKVKIREEEKQELERILGDFRQLSPGRMREFEQKTSAVRQEVNQITDNIFAVRAWILKTNPNFRETDVNKHFQIPEDLDNI